MRHLYSDHRRVLLIDGNERKQNLRAALLRNHEIEVHTANSVQDAEPLWKIHSYDLVLLAATENCEEASLVSNKIRERRPSQRIGLLVGPPVYIRELARVRKKPAAIPDEQAVPSTPISRPIPSRDSGAPQWQQMVQRLLVDWYAARVLSVRYASRNQIWAPHVETQLGPPSRWTIPKTRLLFAPPMCAKPCILTALYVSRRMLHGL
jgi:CheY-like chemotaxis protein